MQIGLTTESFIKIQILMMMLQKPAYPGEVLSEDVSNIEYGG